MKKTALSVAAATVVVLLSTIAGTAGDLALSGTSTFGCTVSTPPFSFDAFSSSHRVVLELDEWSFSGQVAFSLPASWNQLLFEFQAPWFEGGTLTARTEFDPILGVWEYLDVDVNMRIEEFFLDFAWHFEDCVDDTYTRFRVMGSVDDALIDLEVGFTGFMEEFSSFNLNVDIPRIADCNLGAEISIEFSCDGLEELEISTSGITIENLPWLTLKATLLYTLDEKRLILSPIFDLYSAPCFDLFISSTNTGGNLEPLAVQDIYIEGIKLTCTIPPNTEVLSATALDDSANARMTGFIDYFEVISVAQPFTRCCDVVGRWQIYYYFDRTSTSLFDVGMIRFEIVSTSPTNHTSTGVDFRFYTDTSTFTVSLTFGLTW